MDNPLVLTFVKVGEPKIDQATGQLKNTKSIMFRGDKTIVHNDDLGVDVEKTKFYCVSICASNDSNAIVAKFTNEDGTKKEHTFSPDLYEESVLSETMSMLNPK